MNLFLNLKSFRHLATPCAAHFATRCAARVGISLLLIGSLSQAAKADTFVVDTVSDANLTACTDAPNDCSFRGAINKANAHDSADDINFFIPGRGIHIIEPLSVLPTITDDNTRIDATTQPSYNGLPLIQISGNKIPDGVTANGLTIENFFCAVRALTLNGWTNAVVFNGAKCRFSTIFACQIGTDALGTGLPAKRNTVGVAVLNGASSIFIGDLSDSLTKRNIISGNILAGVRAANSGGVVVRENYIGLDRNGKVFGTTSQRALYGVLMQQEANQCEIRGNLIAGQARAGVRIENSSSNGITDNVIGLDALGNAIGNGVLGDGVQIINASRNFVGNTNPAYYSIRNIISGHAGNGILISGAQSSNNAVLNNYIGTDASGAQARGNQNGIKISDGATNTIIGEGNSGENNTGGNLISGNERGILISGARTSQIDIYNCFIGTNRSGTTPLANQIGIEVQGSYDVKIGAVRTPNGLLGRNVVSGNAMANIRFSQAAFRNVISSNLIGTDIYGKKALGGAAIAGIWFNNAVKNTIGGATQEARNIISGNAGYGILMENRAGQNTVQGNFIGLDASGRAKITNDKDGIAVLQNSKYNQIGGAGAARNVISGNEGRGVTISGNGCVENSVAGNYIGISASGYRNVGNGLEGVAIEDSAYGNWIGQRGAGLGNVITGNGALRVGSAGILITGNNSIASVETSYNRIINCYIGTDPTGTTSPETDTYRGNNGPGIILSHGARFNFIGLSGPWGRNVISQTQPNEGISVLDAHDNKISNNFIGLKANGREALLLPSGYGGGVGIFVTGNKNEIGGLTAGDRNVISGNFGSGIEMRGVGNVVHGNFIGTDAGGTKAVPNAASGIRVTGRDHVIGGLTSAERNVIAGNGIEPNLKDGDSFYEGNGIYIENAVNIKIQGNFIGVDAFGRAALPNKGYGIFTKGGTLINIGGATTRPGIGAGNVISGNILSGISSDKSNINGNLIGTDFTGAKAVPNQDGITIRGADTAVGSENPQGRNIISGNAGAGVLFSFAQPSRVSNGVVGNYIGTDISGQKAVPNSYGVYSLPGSTANVGNITTKPGTGNGNVISGNTREAIYAGGGAVSFGNAIGVAADGTTPLPNGAGITILGSGTIGAAANIYRTGSYQNIIAYNHGVGVRVTGQAEIRANSIFSNDGLGIDQGEEGITPSQAVDAVVGPYFRIPFFPVLQSATQSAPDAPLIIQGSVQVISGQHPLDVFASDEPDPSGYGEGQIYLGSFNLAARPDVFTVTFNQVLPVDIDLTGKFITTTISSSPSNSNTSEFSKAVPITAAQGSTESSYSNISATAYSSSGSVVIAFDTRLQSVALQNVTAKINGQNVAVQSAEINGQILTVLLPNDSFNAGDTVEIFWRDLRTHDGRSLTGNTPPLMAE